MPAGAAILKAAPGGPGKRTIDVVLTCRHCGEPIEHADGLWFHPHRRFRGSHGSLPTLCDFGSRLGPTHATPIALIPADKDFLYSVRVAADDESFLLEALWLDWQQANVNTGDCACAGCGAAANAQHSLDCQRRAPMVFEGGVVHLRHAVRH